jgi:hypothetical protein
MTTRTSTLIPIDAIAKQIAVIRGQRVIFDSDLAKLYGVSTSVLNQAVKRNQERFDEDFMFQLTAVEYQALRSQFVISKFGSGGRRYLPYVFTEHGAYMAGNVLSSKRAVEVSKFIVRAFIQMRDLLATHKNIARQLSDLEKRVGGHDEKIAQIINTIHRLLQPPPEPKKRSIGFHTSDDDE